MFWITWENQIRNKSMSKALDLPLYVILSRRGRFFRYLSCGSRTIALIMRQRPRLVICQNPSLVLTLLLLFLRPLFRFKVVVDAHYAGVQASNQNSVLQRLLNVCNKAADLVIVTNLGHASFVESIGGSPFICPDPIPNLSNYYKFKDEVDGKVFFICSFDTDEPYLEVFKAAEGLHSDNFKFFVSGNYKKADIVIEDFPYINFLGYISNDEFYRHLFTSEIVIDLTNNDNCLVCGAYEAMEAEKPLILSEKKALIEFFNKGTVFTENVAISVSNAVQIAKSNKESLKDEARIWRKKEKNEGSKRLESLYLKLRGLCGND